MPVVFYETTIFKKKFILKICPQSAIAIVWTCQNCSILKYLGLYGRDMSAYTSTAGKGNYSSVKIVNCREHEYQSFC